MPRVLTVFHDVVPASFPDDFRHWISRHGTVQLDSFTQRNSNHFQIYVRFWANWKLNKVTPRFSLVNGFKRKQHGICTTGVSRLADKVSGPFFARKWIDQAALLPVVEANWWIRFLERKLEVFLVMVRSRYGLSMVYRLSLVCSNFTFSVGIQLFALRTIGKPGLIFSFQRSDLRHTEVQGEVHVQDHPVFQPFPVLCG